jgi:hypothetical protein
METSAWIIQTRTGIKQWPCFTKADRWLLAGGDDCLAPVLAEGGDCLAPVLAEGGGCLAPVSEHLFEQMLDESWREVQTLIISHFQLVGVRTDIYCTDFIFGTCSYFILGTSSHLASKPSIGSRLMAVRYSE